MKRGIFIHFFDLAGHSGISKKILAQHKAFNEAGVEMLLCHTTIDNSGNHYRVCDGETIESFGKGLLALYKKWFSFKGLKKYLLSKDIDFIYVRSFYNTNFAMLRMFGALKRAGVKIILEFPTYPYKRETEGGDIKHRVIFLFNRFYRLFLRYYVFRAVTFTSLSSIHGIKTINISNAIDFDTIRLKKESAPLVERGAFNLVGVADIHYWHGFDRAIKGIGEYYKRYSKNLDYEVHFYIVGNGEESYMAQLEHIRDEYNINDYIHFTGNMQGDALDSIFDISHFGIASLARHRSGIYDIKTLKNREYAARGIPFIYSEQDADFDNMQYVLKASVDDSPIDIFRIIRFYKELSLTSLEIRNSIVDKLSWGVQIQKVLTQIYKDDESN
jgi:glycosyltransferase involved in cell wall biosynthesis